VCSGGLKACLKYYEKLSPKAFEAVKSMLVFDAVICNEDRHFGLLRDNRAGDILCPAPLFDHDYSLFNFATPGDFADFAAYAKHAARFMTISLRWHLPRGDGQSTSRAIAATDWLHVPTAPKHQLAGRALASN